MEDIFSLILGSRITWQSKNRHCQDQEISDLMGEADNGRLSQLLVCNLQSDTGSYYPIVSIDILRIASVSHCPLRFRPNGTQRSTRRGKKTDASFLFLLCHTIFWITYWKTD